MQNKNSKHGLHPMAFTYHITILTMVVLLKMPCKEDLRLNAQSTSFSGVNMHSQNGVVERQNRFITESARRMLLHTEQLRPKDVSPLFWPFALTYAVHIHNHFSLNEKGITPLERFLTGNSLLDNVLLFSTHLVRHAMFWTWLSMFQNGIHAVHYLSLLVSQHYKQTKSIH